MNTTQTQSVNLKPQFIMKDEDKNFLNSLPANLPDEPLTKKQKDRINSLYYSYISKNGVLKGWGIELYDIERKEKWPSGPRVKLHEAQRMILGWLLNENVHPSITWERFAIRCHTALTGRESYQILLSKIYDIN